MTFRRRFFEKLNLARDHRRYKINKRSTKNFTVCTQKPEYRPSVPNLKNILMAKRQLIKNQPVLREIFNDPPILQYRKRRWLKDTLANEPNFEGQRSHHRNNWNCDWPVYFILQNLLVIVRSNGFSRNLSKMFL